MNSDNHLNNNSEVSLTYIMNSLLEINSETKYCLDNIATKTHDNETTPKNRLDNLYIMLENSFKQVKDTINEDKLSVKDQLNPTINKIYKNKKQVQPNKLRIKDILHANPGKYKLTQQIKRNY